MPNKNTQNITKTKAALLVKKKDGKLRTATFLAENGVRTMRFRLKPGAKPQKGKAAIGMLTVWDTQARDFRTINLQTLKSVRSEGVLNIVQ